MPSFKTKDSSRRRQAAFTLIELLTVVVIISLLFAFGSLALRGALGGQKLAAAVGMLRHDIGWASIESSRLNLPVHLRFYKFVSEEADETEQARFHAYQFLVVDSKNSVMKPLDSVERFPEGIVLHPNSDFTSIASLGEKAPVLDGEIADPEIELPPYTYIEFQFQPDGSTDLPADGKWSITLVKSVQLTEDDSQLPKSYRSIVINPYTAATRAY